MDPWTTGKRVPLQFDIERMHRLAAKHTAYPTFFALIDAAGATGPTLRADDAEQRVLANAYNATQAVNGDARRAFRA